MPTNYFLRCLFTPRRHLPLQRRQNILTQKKMNVWSLGPQRPPAWLFLLWHLRFFPVLGQFRWTQCPVVDLHVRDEFFACFRRLAQLLNEQRHSLRTHAPIHELLSSRSSIEPSVVRVAPHDLSWSSQRHKKRTSLDGTNAVCLCL